ncbi:hypothetical protein JK635_07945 [Neobacillus sp. YIM B02564]|uniref:Lipoprotein n=1 Tax=Neobacillus paridis TaxID=2803862 RepID=A0ABS1TLJ7_9BACI|nr:hypothetical protein [Neobacillus paridis]MBL4952142.1 hypothetical protein [Neobacillus paridis]
MKKWIAGGVLLAMSISLLGGCSEQLRYGEQINSQNVIDTSRTQDEVVADILRNANPIMSILMNGETNTFSEAQLESMLTTEMERTQKAINKLEQYRQPDSLNRETKQTFQALVNYKSALLFLRERVKKGEPADAEVKQLVEAINILQSSHFVKP